MPVGRTPSSAGGNGQSDPKVGFAAAPFVSELGCVLGTPNTTTTAYAAKVEPQEAEALAATKVYDSTPLFINLETLDLDCAECGTQAAQFPWSQILGEGLLRFDRWSGRGDDPRPTEARVLIKSRLLYQYPS